MLMMKVVYVVSLGIYAKNFVDTKVWTMNSTLKHTKTKEICFTHAGPKVPGSWSGCQFDPVIDKE